jgi:hypothetical protein
MFAGVHVPHPPSPGGDDLQPTEACAHRIDARERPMLPNPESLKRIHEESGVIARKISSETSSFAQNAVRTHSTIGDKNFVQNYYKASNGVCASQVGEKYEYLGYCVCVSQSSHDSFYDDTEFKVAFYWNMAKSISKPCWGIGEEQKT